MKCVRKTCNREVVPGYSKCKICLDQNVVYMRNKRAKDKKYYERELVLNRLRSDRYESEGRCRRCSLTLDPDVDNGFKHCLNCRERNQKC